MFTVKTFVFVAIMMLAVMIHATAGSMMHHEHGFEIEPEYENHQEPQYESHQEHEYEYKDHATGDHYHEHVNVQINGQQYEQEHEHNYEQLQHDNEVHNGLRGTMNMGQNGGHGMMSGMSTSCPYGMANIPCLRDNSLEGDWSRTVKVLYKKNTTTPTGLSTKTWSKSGNTQAQDWLYDHIERMTRMEGMHGVRLWDPQYAALHKVYDNYELECDKTTDSGVSCQYTLKTDDQCVFDLVKAHANLVSQYTNKDKVIAAMKAKHEVPDSCK
jgi:hypothetical protein